VRLKQFTPRETQLCATGKKQEKQNNTNGREPGPAPPVLLKNTKPKGQSDLKIIFL